MNYCNSLIRNKYNNGQIIGRKKITIDKIDEILDKIINENEALRFASELMRAKANNDESKIEELKSIISYLESKIKNY